MITSIADVIQSIGEESLAALSGVNTRIAFEVGAIGTRSAVLGAISKACKAVWVAKRALRSRSVQKII